MLSNCREENRSPLHTYRLGRSSTGPRSFLRFLFPPVSGIYRPQGTAAYPSTVYYVSANSVGGSLCHCSYSALHNCSEKVFRAIDFVSICP